MKCLQFECRLEILIQCYPSVIARMIDAFLENDLIPSFLIDRHTNAAVVCVVGNDVYYCDGKQLFRNNTLVDSFGFRVYRVIHIIKNEWFLASGLLHNIIFHVGTKRCYTLQTTQCWVHWGSVYYKKKTGIVRINMETRTRHTLPNTADVYDITTVGLWLTLHSRRGTKLLAQATTYPCCLALYSWNNLVYCILPTNIKNKDSDVVFAFKPDNFVYHICGQDESLFLQCSEHDVYVCNLQTMTMTQFKDEQLYESAWPQRLFCETSSHIAVFE